MADILWGDRYPVDQAVAAQVDAAADRNRLPRNVLRAHVIAESGVGAGGRVDPNAHNQSGEDSVGLLQGNRNGGQGSGYSVAELKDPARNLAILVPPIAKAWNAHPELGITRARVLRAAAESGHPGDPERMNRGDRSWQIATTGTERIASIWQVLEGVAPTVPSGGVFGLGSEPLRRTFDEAQRAIQERPVSVILGAVGLVVVLAVL